MPDFLDDFIAGKPPKQSKRGRSGTLTPDNSRIQAIHDGANALGIDPLDYATVISYESAGTFDPWKAGPTTKWGQHRGTIQYGEPQRREFGVYKGQTFEDQVTTSNVKYLKKAGVKPGADLLSIYKAINGGNVKVSENASDGYGTIKTHVQKMMGAHRTKAAKFLGNSYNSQNSTGNNALDSFINQSANNAPANIDDFINAPVGEETAPMLGAAPEQTVDSVSPLYPAPASQAAPKPVPESDFTIGEQIQSALKPDSPRATVLLTEDNQINAVTPENRNLFTPVRTPNGTLVVSNEKASRLGLNTPEDISAHVAKNGFASLIGHVEDVGNNTGEGMAVQTKAPDGSELVTSVVTTPEVATEQLLNHQKQFGGKIGKQEILPVAEAVQAREASDIANLGKANVGTTNFGAELAPEKMPADYFEYLKAREAVDSPELRNEYVSMKQSNPTAYNQTPDVQASVPPAQTYPRRETKPNESYYQFEKDGKTESGDEYLGMLNGKHRFKNADGDELELDETNKQLKPVGTAKRAFDADKNEYLLASDQSNLKQGEVRRAGKDGVNYIFQPDNKIREENPKLVLGEGEQQITQSDSQENVPQGKVRVADKTGKTFFASKAEDGKYSLTEEVERPKATEEDYKTWFDYQKKFVDKSIVDLPETRVRFETSLAEADKTNFGSEASATQVQYSNPKTSSGRVNNLASQPKGGIVGVPAQTASNPSLQSPTTFAPGSYDNIQREIFGTIQPSKIYREKPTAEQYLADAQRETYGANFDAANEAARRLTGEPLIDYSAEVSQADIDSGFNPNTGKVEGLQVAGSEKVRRAVEAFEKGGEEGLKNILPILEGTANPAPTEPEPDTDAILRAQAKENLVRTPLAGTSEADIEAEFQRLKSNQLSPETESVLSGIGENLQNLPYASQGVGRVIGGAIGGLGRLSDNLAGLERFSTSRLLHDYAVNPLLSLIGITPSDTSGTEKIFRQLGTGARIISTESSKGLGIAGELANMAGGALVDIPKLIGLSMLPGGAVVALGIDAGTQAAGRGDRLDTVGKEAAKGAVLGALFGAGSKLGKLVETGAQGALLTTGKTAAADVLLATKILGEATKIGTVFNGTFILEKATGARTDDAFKSAILNTIFDVVMQGQKIGQIKDLAGKAFRMNGNGKSADVTVDPNGEVKLLTEKLQPEFVDAEFDVSKVKDVELDENGVYRERGDTAAIQTPNREVTAVVVEEAGVKRLTGEIAPEPEVGAVVEVSVKAENGRNIVKTGTVTELVQERGLKPSVRVEFEDGSQQIVPQRKTTVTEVKNDDSITLPSNKEVEQTSVKDEISAPETALQSNEIESRYKNLPTQKLQEVKVEKPVAKVITTTRPNIAEKLNVFTERGTKAAIEPKVIDSSEILTSLDEGYPQELQPRDRSRAASKAQISEIANKLNPEFLGDSPKASDGRPLVVPVELDGKTKYAVISGNGRTAGIREAYNLENEGSRKYAEFARGKGETSAQQPVYVGVLDSSEVKNLPDFAKEANESATAQMSATEQAKTDAERISSGLMAKFVPSDDGTIHGAANRDFVRSFMDSVASPTERGKLVDSSGALSQEGAARVRNAIFAKAFGDSPEGMSAISRMAESTDNNVKNITNGLLQKAGQLAELKEAGRAGTRFAEFDITKDLSKVMEKYSALKDSGSNVDEYLKQQNLFGAETTPFQNQILKVLDTHKRSAKGIRSIVGNYLSAVEAIGNPNQKFLFDGSETPSAESVFEAAVKSYERNIEAEPVASVGLFNIGQGNTKQSEARPPGDETAPADGGQAEEQADDARQNRISSPFYSRPEQLRSSSVNAGAFYSAVERTIENSQQNKFNADQIKALLNPAKGAGIKQEELDWLGVDEFLAGKDKVTKDEILDFIRENQVELEEVVSSNSFDWAQESDTEWQSKTADSRTITIKKTKDTGYESDYKIYVGKEYEETKPMLQMAKDYVTKTFGKETTKFSQYTLPGGENYKELLLTMPTETSRDVERRQELARIDRDRPLSEKEQAEYDLLQSKTKGNSNTYTSSHFDEPNILAHIRFDERTNANGSRTLHIAEIQSDWHQQARKEGYKRRVYSVINSETGRTTNHGTHTASDGRKYFENKTEAQKAADERGFTIQESDLGSVPDAPFKKSWQELGFKKALRYAVENNFDAVSWDTGEVQADRYDLAKQIESVKAYKNDGGYWFKASRKGHGENDDYVSKEGLSEADLADNIGKETAQKILDKINENENSAPDKVKKAFIKLDNADLKIGGEGMKGFYDKILPNFANKYVKKWGSKVDQANTSIAKPQDGGWKQVRINPTEYRDFELIGVNRTSGEEGVISTFDTQREAENELKRYQQSDDIVPVHSVAITPEMRESVMKGQPLFNKPDTKEQAVQDKFGQAVDDVLDGKNTEASKLTDDLNLAIGQDVTVETLKNARISATGKMNEAAFALMTHANLKVFRNAAKEAWFGMFLNPQRTQKVRAALTELLGAASPGLARIYGARVLKQFDAATGENGGIKLIASSKNAPEGLEQAWQEESAHEVDYFTGNRHQISEEIFPTDEIGQKAMSHLGENAYRDESESLLAIEVGAKIWRDDAETELNLSSEEIEHLRNLQIDALRAAGKTIEDIKTAFKDVSQSARKFTENYERENQSGQGNRTSGENFKPGGEGEIPRQIRGERERSGSGRSSDLLSASRLKRQETAQNRQNQDLDKYKKPENTELKRFKRDANSARGPGNGSLVKHEIAIVERRFKKDPENLKAAKDEILYARASVPQTKTGAGLMKIGKFAVDIISAPKSFMSSFDISAAGRQGAVLSLSEPRIAARAFIQQIQSFRKVNYDNFVRDLNLHPFVEMAEASGLYLSTLSDQDALGKREEAFMSRLLGEEDYIKNKVGEKIRRIGTAHVRVSERAYLTYLDSLRINSFEKLAKQVNEYNLRKGLDKNEIIDAENNVTRIQDQMTALAEFVNYATGRGSLGVFENAAGVLNAGMFSPRYIMSRLQLLNPAFYAKLPPGVRKTALKKMLGFAGATAVIMGLLKLAGGEVELGDPEESDFLLKVKFGAFHYDFGAGFAQPIRYLARLIGAANSRFIEGKPLNAYGKVDKKGFGESKESSLTKQFARTKLSPALGSAINLYTGTNMIGEKSTLGSEATNLVLPMITGDIQKAFEMERSLGVAKMLPSLVGIGTGVYDKKKKKKEPEERAEREEKPEKPEK